MIALLIHLVIVGLILYVIWWAINQIPLPEPIRTVINVVFVLVVALVAISLLMGIGGMTSVGGPWPAFHW